MLLTAHFQRIVFFVYLNEGSNYVITIKYSYFFQKIQRMTIGIKWHIILINSWLIIGFSELDLENP